MFQAAIRLLKSAVHRALGMLGYRLVRLHEPAPPPPLPTYSDWNLLGVESSTKSVDLNLPYQLAASAAAREAVAAIEEQKKEQTKKRDYQTIVRLRQQYRRDLKIDRPAIRIISSDWLKNIGQIAHLDVYFKLKALGLLEPSETIICLDGVTPVNRSLLSYYVPFAKHVVPNRAALGNAGDLMELLAESTVAVRLADGKVELYHSLLYEVATAWQRAARPPLISLRPAHRAAGRRWLSSLGLPDDGLFATFHCRTTINHQDLRSVRPETYTRAMEAVIRAGGWVVCMGTPTLADLHPKIINLENHRTPEDDWKDVFLLADCRFFVGCTSGPADVVNAFGAPSIMVNTLQLALQAACNHDLFIPKLFLSRKSGRLLTITESLENFGTAWASEPGDLTPLGVDLIDNTPQEIEAVVCEMIDRLDGVAVDIAPWEEAAQQRLRELRIPSSINHTHGPIVAGKTRMGRDFLRRNAPALGLVSVHSDAPSLS